VATRNSSKPGRHQTRRTDPRILVNVHGGALAAPSEARRDRVAKRAAQTGGEAVNLCNGAENAWELFSVRESAAARRVRCPVGTVEWA
jgi:hypothetical protein